MSTVPRAAVEEPVQWSGAIPRTNDVSLVRLGQILDAVATLRKLLSPSIMKASTGYSDLEYCASVEWMAVLIFAPMHKSQSIWKSSPSRSNTSGSPRQPASVDEEITSGMRSPVLT